MEKKTHCKRGHEFTEGNTYITKIGLRHCKECRKETMRLRRAGTQVGNANSRKINCAKGHPYDEENTIHSVTSKGAPRRWCKTCEKANQARQRVKRYGITVDDYAEMLVSHENKCGICGREFSRSPHIDHDHNTGKVRGLLCYPCNSGLGQFQDSPEILKKAVEYLERFTQTTEE